MAKTRADLHKEAANAGKIAPDTDPDGYTVAELEELLSDDETAWKGSLSVSGPVKVPSDGHESLTVEDFKNRG